MEINNFLTQETLMTFMGTLIIVELWVGFTKELPIIKLIPTKVYTLILSVIHMFIINVATGIMDINMTNIYWLLCNSLIISVLLSSGYDVCVGKINVTGISNKENKQINNK